MNTQYILPLYLKLDDLRKSQKRKAEIEELLYVNPNSGKVQFCLIDLYAYYLMIY